MANAPNFKTLKLFILFYAKSGAPGFHAAVTALAHQIPGLGHVVLLRLNLCRRQAHLRCNALPGNDLIAAVQNLIVAPQEPVTQLQKAGIDIAGRGSRLSGRGGRVARG